MTRAWVDGVVSSGAKGQGTGSRPSASLTWTRWRSCGSHKTPFGTRCIAVSPRYQAEHDDCNVPRTSSADPEASPLVYEAADTKSEEADSRPSASLVWMRWGSFGNSATARGTKCTSGSLPIKPTTAIATVPTPIPLMLSWHAGVASNDSERGRARSSPSASPALRLWGLRGGHMTNAWDEMYSRLATYKAKHDHCDVSESDDPQLSSWCEAQRGDKRKGRLSSVRIAQLDTAWIRVGTMGRAMERAIRATGGVSTATRRLLSASKTCAESCLGKWVSTQRVFSREGKLSQDRKARLDALGFAWTVRSGAHNRARSPSRPSRRRRGGA